MTLRPSRPRAALAAALLCAALLLLGWMVWSAAAPPVVRHARVALPGWPRGAAGLRLVLISDLHVAWPGDTPRRLAQTVARINALHPDIVVLAGDTISTGAIGVRRVSPAASAAPLAALHPRLGSYAVLGNHDTEQPLAVVQALQAAHVRVLANTAVRLGPIALLGLGDRFSGLDRLAPLVDQWRRIGGVPVLFTHSPDSIPLLPPDIHLALAGHTHCGQVVLPVWGPIQTQSRYGRRYACGAVREGDRLAIIGAGLGTSRLPIRLGAPPDFWVIDLGGDRGRTQRPASPGEG